jgi:hypothetical protein
MDDRIRHGHDPEWQRAFQHLDQAGRARVRQAVSGGGSLPDPTEAAVAAGLARRQQRMLLRQTLIMLPLQVGLAVTWLGVLLPPARLPTGFRWCWAAVLTLLLGLAPVLLWRRYQTARHAANNNERAVRRWPGRPEHPPPC